MIDQRFVVDDGRNVIYTKNGEGIIIASAVTIPGVAGDGEDAAISKSDLALRAGARIIYNDVDITVDIASWVLSMEYTDGIEKADDLQITLWDDGRWRTSWAPDEGSKIEAEIFVIEGEKVTRMPCGSFKIDEIEYTGPPQQVSIKATSAYATTALRREKKTRAWENTNLKSIASTIASKNGLKLFYSSNTNPAYVRIDQKSKSDLEFLQNIVEREGLRVKTSNDLLIIYSQSEYDDHAGVDAFFWGDMKLKDYSFISGITTAYNKAIVKYRNPKTKKVFEYEYKPEDAPVSGQTLRINERCESQAEAERIAKNRLEAKNRNIKDASLSVIGNTKMAAGQNIDIKGFGLKIDGRYAVEEAQHTLWPYTTNLQLRKI